jgi:hypothetical protein
MEEPVQNEPSVEEMFSATEPAPAAAATPKPESEPVYKYTALGKEREEPLSVILKRASQGYDYSQKIAEMKAQQAAFEDQKRAVLESEGRWKPYDDYAKQNPEWYQHWSQAWEQRQAQPGQIQETNPAPWRSEIEQLKSEFGGVKEFISKQKQSLEDKAYWDEVASVQKEFDKLDLSQADENGETLEYKVLKHAKENGINSFRVAFRDYFWDKAKEIQSQKAKEEHVKTIQDKRKTGILGVTDKPTRQSEPNIRMMSDREIEEAAIAYALNLPD